MDFKGKKVKHISLGVGTIMGFNDNGKYIDILFSSDNRIHSFPFPEFFESNIKVLDKDAETEINNLLKEAIKIRAEETETKKTEVKKAEIEERKIKEEKTEPVKIENESETFCGYRSASCAINVQFEDGTDSTYIIVNDEEEEDFKNNVFHYRSRGGLELLSAAFAKQRNKEGSIRGKKYEVKKVDYNRGIDNEYKIMTSLIVKPHGGYIESIKNEYYQKIIDVLLYSLAEDRYEVIHATYDTRKYECYIDLAQYKTYIRKYGKPDLKLKSGKKGGRFQGDLNDESILKLFGYDVNRTDNYSSGQRQNVLMQVVDLKLLTVEGVARFLNHLIDMHPDEKYEEARAKWEKDIEFIQDYKVNPDRFLIAK